MLSVMSALSRLRGQLYATWNTFIFIAALSVTGPLAGCLSTSQGNGSKIDSFNDPDPDNDPDAPNLCNPTGKKGAELAKCQEQNNTYFAQFEEEAKKREPWFNFPQDSWLDSSQLDGKYIVIPSEEEGAIKRLLEAPIVELSASEVKQFSGKDLAFPGRQAYLVRGLVYAKESGSFNVFEKNSSIYVRHEAEGAQPSRETRSAVIVWLSYKPQSLYVDCQVIE